MQGIVSICVVLLVALSAVCGSVVHRRVSVREWHWYDHTLDGSGNYATKALKGVASTR